MKILKYSLPINTEYHCIRCPDAPILKCEIQNDRFCFWMVSHADEKDIPDIHRIFKLYPTGEVISLDDLYHGTAQMITNDVMLPYLVLHLFERLQK